MGDFNTLLQEENIKEISNEDMDQEFEEFKQEIQTEKISIDDTAEAFDDHGTEILEGIMEDMMTNFAKIDGEGETDPKLETYELAYQAFETDIEALIAQSKVVEKKEETSTENVKQEETYVDDIYAGSTTTKKTKEKTPKYVNKLNELLTVVEDIKYLVQLKKLEEGKDPGEEFDAGKLMVFAQKTKYFKENPPKTEGETRQSLITKKEATITEEKTKIETEKKNALSVQEALNTNRTEETAKNFFETAGNEETFNAVFDYMATISKGDLCEYKTEVNGDKTKEQHRDNFVDLLSLYIGKDVTSITLEKAGGKDIYIAGKRIVVCKYSYTETKNEKQTTITEIREITFGSQDQMQKDRTEAFNVEDPNLKLANDNPLTQFDGRGNYRAFEKYIKTKKGGKDFTDNFKHTIDAILAYKKPSEKTNADNIENENDLKNGYANALTDYILSVHPTLSKIYISYLTPGNLNILGVDKDTRIANLNKLGKSTEFMNSLTEDEKKIISDISISALEEKKVTLQDAINNMSNIIVSLMKMFGFGKGTLKSRFPSLADKIDGIYHKEFELDPKEIECITKMKGDKNLSETANEKRVKDKTYTVPKADELKTLMSTRTITGEMTTTYKDYLSYIDPKILKKGITLYNKTADTKITQSDFIITKNGNISPNVKGIEKNPDTFKLIMEQLLKSDETRKTIAIANASIRKTTTTKAKDGTTKEMSEYFDDKDERKFSIIKSQKDVATFFGAYLFAGSKSLAYTVTENNLVKSEWTDDGSETVTEEPLASYKINKETKLYQDSDVTKTTDMKVGDKVTATKETKIKTGIDLKLKGFDAIEFRQIKSADGTIGWIEKSTMDEVVEVADTKKKLDIDTKYATVSAEGIYTLTAAVEPTDIKIHNIFIGTLPETLKFTSKSTGKEVTIVKGKDPKDNTTNTYLDEQGKRVVIREGDKLEAIPEVVPETIASKRETINTELIKDDVKKAKTTFEGVDNKPVYIDEKNLYQQQLTKLSNIFTGGDYLTLISEESTKTLSTMVKDNMAHLKNMMRLWNLQILNKNKAYTDIISKSLTTQEMNNIDPEKQTYEVKEAKDKSITIAVTKNKYESGKDAKEGTINFSKDANGVLTVTWTDKPVETKETPATT